MNFFNLYTKFVLYFYLKASPNSSGGYTIENNGQSGGVSGFDSKTFYRQFEQSERGDHMGGIAVVPAQQTILTTTLPGSFRGGVAFVSEATRTYDKDNGEVNLIFDYDDTLPDPNPLFAKANGLGDIEISCPTAPIEIGNRVWIDTDKDGIQDAGEEGINGVVFELYEGTTATGTPVQTVTSATNGGQIGTWYFTNLKPNQDYVIKVKTALGAGALAAFGVYSPTGAGTILTDNNTGNGTIALKTGNMGENNHSYDVGVTEKPDPNCVTTPPTSVLGPNVLVCKGEAYPTLKATIVGTGTVDWYKTATGGAAVATGTLEYKPTGNVAVNDTFYLAARSTLPNSANCPTISERTRLVVVAQNCVVEIDLALKKSINKKVAKLGDELTYTVQVFNQLSVAATGVEVTDSLATTVQFVTGSFAASRGAATITGNVIKWNIGNIAASPDTVTLTYKVKATQQGVHFNTAEISKTNEKDKDSTPGNDKDEEDDLDRQCFSVPIQLCTGEKIQASVPTKFTGVKWFKDGQEQTALAGQNMILLTETGNYTFTATNQTCPASGCCPIIVEAINCCPADLCIPFTVRKTKKK